MNKKIKRLGVFTSGGDAPGMNAAVRAVVRTAIYHDVHVYGIYHGYEGMINGEIKRLDKGDVANILQLGGTKLKTARSIEFHSEKGREMAYDSLCAHDIDACIAIGGDGTYTGAKVFTESYDIPFVGLPGTIDNDIYGTDYTIGFDTAINTAVEAIDKIRDTADSHNRLFFIEVMGRHAGYIALHTGIGTGAGCIFLPETDTDIDNFVEQLLKKTKRKKLFNLVVVAEGNQNGNAMEIATQIKDKYGIDSKITIIGHLQRGGSPSAFDRVLASRLGFAAVNALLEGRENMALGVINDQISYTSFSDAISKNKEFSMDMVHMAQVLSL